MAIYRGVVRHVRYWRGNLHHWSTVYHFSGTPTSAFTSADATTLLNADRAFCYTGAAANGGTYECDIYSQASGGVPITSVRAFDPTVPGAFIADVGSNYSSTTSFAYETTAENALLVEWAAGISSSGKGVRLRKWFHAVSSAATTSGTGSQVSTPNITSLTAAANTMVNVFGSKGMVMASSTGRLAGAATVSPFYSNHQMPRGRKRKTSSSSSGLFSISNIETILAAADAGAHLVPAE